jgi:two-component system alkaline phosphatase synthesis response regulator PhoP
MSKRRILIVDDEAHILQMLEIRLKKNGFDVLTASTGESALSQVRSTRPDLILLDVMMPPPDGYEVCRRLKHDPLFKDIPVILLTAKSTPRDQAIGLEAGADAYMTKPYSPEELLGQIQELISS